MAHKTSPSKPTLGSTLYIKPTIYQYRVRRSGLGIIPSDHHPFGIISNARQRTVWWNRIAGIERLDRCLWKWEPIRSVQQQRCCPCTRTISDYDICDDEHLISSGKCLWTSSTAIEREGFDWIAAQANIWTLRIGICLLQRLIGIPCRSDQKR